METRRTIIAAAVGMAALSPLRAKGSAEPSLAQLAAGQGLRFGSEIGLPETKDRRLVSIIDRETALLVPGNEFKMYSILPGGPYPMRFEDGDQFQAFARRNKKPVRGHNLVWLRDDASPDWLKNFDFGRQPKVAAETFLRKYIHDVTQHFGPDISSWDVVNEAVEALTGELRDSAFTRILGMDAVRIAFEAARESLPTTPLVYNDYMDWRADREPHRQGVLRLLRWLKEHHVPIDALGIQSHIRTPETPFDPDRWEVFLQGIKALGIDMAVTEFSLSDQMASGSVAERDQKAAGAARLYLQQVLSFTEVKEVLVWGMCDRYAYVGVGKGRADGLPVRQAPYDAAFRPKPLRNAIGDALRTAPARRPGLKVTSG